MNQKGSPRAEEYTRRSERVLLRIPIEVKGKSAEGKRFRESTFTLVINRNGARINLRNSPPPGDTVTITNLQNEMSCPFRVVGRTDKSLGEGPEWGVECLEPEVNFWGIYFPKKVEAPAKQESIDALLECVGCHFQELAQLTLEQYKTLSTQSSLSRDCAQCDATTEWKFGFAAAEPEEAAADQPVQAASPSLAAGGAERRRAKRLTAKLPVRVRLPDGREEVTRTENISKTGVCFIADLPMSEGDRVLVSVGYAPGSYEAEVPARVVWRRPMEDMTKAAYGISLEEEA